MYKMALEVIANMIMMMLYHIHCQHQPLIIVLHMPSADLRRLLRAVNFVASYFGDPVLSLKDVEEVNNWR
jgi:hypothetical protein